jgi:hypothetical protein
VLGCVTFDTTYNFGDLLSLGTLIISGVELWTEKNFGEDLKVEKETSLGSISVVPKFKFTATVEVCRRRFVTG